MSRQDRNELLYLIALTMIPSIGPVTAKKLLREIGSAREIFHEKKETLHLIRGIGSHTSKALHASDLLSQAERELEFLSKHQIAALYFQDPDYPDRLKQCSDGPILLYTRGNEDLNPSRSLSVVGTRRASTYGRDICRSIVVDLCKQIENLIIVSGLAYGIDVIAHRAALEGGIPTVAVLGHGLSTLYPSAHRDTARKISQQGALVTDFPSGMLPERNNFLRRNRIIAAMSDATLVVESAASGGSLITAHMAQSYHRDVLAVPGRTLDPRSRGCNRLIRNQVAALVESAEDVLYHLNWDARAVQQKLLFTPEDPCTREEKKIMDLIEQRHPVGPGDLSVQSGLPIHVVMALLTEMELKKWISVEPGNLYHPRNFSR
jgi:DNA processing protein